MILSTQIKPHGDRVLVKVDDSERFAGDTGLIEIPETAREKSRTGIVLAVGPKAHKDLRAGMRVGFAAYGSTKILTEDKGRLELFDGNLTWVILE